MDLGAISWLAVAVAAVSTFVLGGLWYGPLSGKTWMAASGVTEERVVGLTPEPFSRVARFHAVVGAVRGRREVDGARMAYRFDFSDQSHFVREFRCFAGATPTRFLARRTPDEEPLIVESGVGE